MEQNALSTRQQQVLDYVTGFMSQYGGRAPLLKEIGHGVGLASHGVVRRHIDNLVAKGRLRYVRKPHGIRNLALPEARP